MALLKSKPAQQGGRFLSGKASSKMSKSVNIIPLVGVRGEALLVRGNIGRLQ